MLARTYERARNERRVVARYKRRKLNLTWKAELDQQAIVDAQVAVGTGAHGLRKQRLRLLRHHANGGITIEVQCLGRIVPLPRVLGQQAGNKAASGHDVLLETQV